MNDVGRKVVLICDETAAYSAPELACATDELLILNSERSPIVRTRLLGECDYADLRQKRLTYFEVEVPSDVTGVSLLSLNYANEVLSIFCRGKVMRFIRCQAGDKALMNSGK